MPGDYRLSTHADLPRVAIIVPGHNGSRTLEQCLSSLRKQDWPGNQLMLVYVDDASTDGSREIAARFADRIILSSGTPSGPAAARNLGVAHSSEEIVAFFDADVVAQPTTLSTLLKPLLDEPSLDAAFGSYDPEPAHQGVVSQYRNLFHHYTHQRSHEEASTFWAGCGVVRRSSFEQVGGFDSALYPKPMIEDIELGHRMRAAGMRIRLEKDAQVKHLKKWTVPGILKADILYRGIPWMKLLLAERGTSSEIGDLNLKLNATLSIPLVWIGLLLTLFSPWSPPLLLLSLLALSLCVLINLPTYLFFYHVRGLLFAIMTVPLQLLYHFCNGLSVLGGVLSYWLSDRLLKHRGRRAKRISQHSSQLPNTIRVIECTNRSV
jgi:glycosyltransferase involved in cell wall biosynthesis